MPTVFDAATAPIEALHPQPDRAIPGRIGQLLGLVHTLIAYGRNLAAAVQLHAVAPQLLPSFTFIATAFETSNLPLILNRIARGLLRAAALQERLRRRAARGQDFKQPVHLRPPSPSKPHGGNRSARLHNPARNRFLAGPPTLEEIAAEDRRRLIAAILVDICLDLGIEPDQLDQRAWVELYRDIIDYRCNLVTFLSTRWHRSADPAPGTNFSPIPGRPTFPARPAPSPQSKALTSTGPP